MRRCCSMGPNQAAPESKESERGERDKRVKDLYAAALSTSQIAARGGELKSEESPSQRRPKNVAGMWLSAHEESSAAMCSHPQPDIRLSIDEVYHAVQEFERPEAKSCEI